MTDARQEALADLTRFGGAAGFSWPPRAGAEFQWPETEGQLFRLASACVLDDRALATESLRVSEALATGWHEALQSAWWAGAGAFLSARLRTLGLEAQLPVSLRGALLAEEFLCRHRYEHAREHVTALMDRLEAAGLRPVLLKGLAHAEWLYPEPWTRPCGDVDLLLSPSEGQVAYELLSAEGFIASALHGGHSPEGHHHLPPLTRRAGRLPFVVEIHSALAEQGCTRRLAADDLVARSVRHPLLGFRVLQADDQLAHLVLHHPAELTARRLFDVGLAARRCGAAGLARARRLLDPAQRWQSDLVAGLAAHFVDASYEAALPGWRRALLAWSCAPNWGERHLAALRSGFHPDGLGGPVRRPLRCALDRTEVLCRAVLPVALREPRRRITALARLGRELWRGA
ncbi:MAG: nucleotidyltransferase family protein [Planctomycetota bacterium]